MPSSRRRSKSRPPSRFQPGRPQPADRSAGNPAAASAGQAGRFPSDSDREPGASAASAAGGGPGPSAAAGTATPRAGGSDAASRRAERARQRGTRRSRQPSKRPFLERYRTRILSAVVAVAVIAFGAYAYVQATAPAYACETEWTATATPTPGPSQSPQLGYAQGDMGRDHVAVGTVVKYLYCPPASGKHYNQPPLGPIQPKVYGPNDHPVPEGWVHNLEHGALVVLYKCPSDACTDAGQSALNTFYQGFPNSPVCDVPPGIIGPVIARFDDMNYPVVALVWDHILPLQSFDQAQIMAFYDQVGERSNPEPQGNCANPSASPGESVVPAASDAAPTDVPSEAAPSPAGS
ncbi:MAG TPA: DUF3105 domain-containing protein [Candidatus Limnocylindrales bacterium]|nr:DUF3105 domain-containing protein [Candidatus Limnocylindrales bacterium]